MSAEISVTTETLPDSQVALLIAVPQETVDGAYERAVTRLGQRVKIQGFRPGKAPRALIEAKLGQGQLRDEVIDSLVPTVVSQAIQDQGIDAIDRPMLESVEMERGHPAKLRARVSVMPELTLPDPAGLAVPKPATEVGDDLVERELLSLRERFAEVEPVEREIRVGDVVIADVAIRLQGDAEPRESRPAAELDVREGELQPELFAALPGRFAGEVVEVEVQLPDDYRQAELAGKTASLEVTLTGVKEKHVPELDDDLAERISAGSEKTAEGLRQVVRRQLEAQAARVDALAFEQAVLSAIIEASGIKVPGPLLEREVLRELHDLEHRLSHEGIRLEIYLAYLKKTTEEWLNEVRPEVENRLKVDLVVEALARRERIEVSTDEAVAELRRQASDPTVTKEAREILASPDLIDTFRHRYRRRRAIEQMVAQAAAASAETPTPPVS